MRILSRKIENEEGFTLIEAVIGTAIFAVISLALFNLFSVVLGNIRNNKAVLTANSVASEQMEVVRGMDFNNVKTDTGWVPAGSIPSQRNLLRGGINYLIRTDISWVDDPYDGTGDGDSFPYDYKKVRVIVSWSNPIGGMVGRVAMSTNVVPIGLEGMSAGKGGLYLSVFNSSGAPVADADIVVDSAAAGYHLAPADGGKTDANGNIWIADLMPADDYHIAATKNGYSTAQTYAVNNDPGSPDYNPSPEKRNATVISQKAVMAGFQIDALGGMTVKTVHFENPANWKANTNNAGEQTETAAVADSGNVFVAWADTRDAEKHIYLQKMFYSGTSYSNSWASDVKIVDKANASAPALAVLPDGSLYVAWSDNRSGDSDVYLQEINTADGSAVGGELTVSHGSAGTSQNNPDIASDQEGSLYVVWEDNRGGNWDVYAQKLVPSSGSFWGSDLKIDAADAGDQLRPRVVTDRDLSGGANANNFYAVWQGNQTGNFDILFRKFDKNGAPQFSDNTVNSDGSYLDQRDPNIVFDGSNNFYVVWADERNSQADIYFQKLDKNGAALLGGDAKINDDSYPIAYREKPSLVYDSDSAIYVAWEDNRNGSTVSNIFASKINSSGVRQWAYDLVAADFLNSMQTDACTVRDSAGRAVTLWQDNRNGTNDIYGAAYTEMGNYIRPGVPISVVSQKIKGTYKDGSGNDVPIPKYSRTFTSDSNGSIAIGASQGGLEWGTYTFLTQSPYDIISIDLPSPIYVAPGSTVNAIINVGP